MTAVTLKKNSTELLLFSIPILYTKLLFLHVLSATETLAIGSSFILRKQFRKLLEIKLRNWYVQKFLIYNS